MNIALVNGSPKAKNSASGELLRELKAYLPGHSVTQYHVRPSAGLSPERMAEIAGQDALVFSFPLYVDGLPSHLLRALTQMEPVFQGGASPLVYAAVNCGFYEGRQCAHALCAIRLFCKRAGIDFGRGIGIGGGGMLPGLKNVPFGQGPRKNTSSALRSLAQTIEAAASGPDLFADPSFPRFLYKAMAQWGWRKEIRKNGLRPRDLSMRR